MPIPAQYKNRFIYHFCHFDNLGGVLKHGLLSCNQQKVTGLQHKSIAAQGIQRVRSRMVVPCGPGGVLHDYVPLYFCKLSSMFLNVVNKKNVDQLCILYFAFPISILDSPDAVFTDAAANTESEPPQFFDDPDNLTQLNWDAIDSTKWSAGSNSLNHARMAEALIYRTLDPRMASHLIVWDDWIKGLISKEYEDAGISMPTIGNSFGHYVRRFWDPARKRQSLVTGPLALRRNVEDATKDVVDAIGQNDMPTYESLFALRDALRDDFGCTDCTAGILDLPTDNKEHFENVSDHTLRVVKNLLKSSEYEDQCDTDKLHIEIAAYLHDVGKGPHARWEWNGGKQRTDPDHPAEAIPMVQELLKQVGTMKRSSARAILMLVAYHDLVGDIIGRGRNEEQLFEIITDERDLDMLIAIGKADVLAINRGWWDQNAVNELRKRAVKALAEKAESEDA